MNTLNNILNYSSRHGSLLELVHYLLPYCISALHLDIDISKTIKLFIGLIFCLRLHGLFKATVKFCRKPPLLVLLLSSMWHLDPGPQTSVGIVQY